MDSVRTVRRSYNKYADAQREAHPSAEQFIVDFDSPGDPMNPRNFRYSTKVLITLAVSLVAVVATLASSVTSGAHAEIAEGFKVRMEVAELSTSLFLCGFAMGAIPLAPLSEELGRLPVYVVSLLFFSLFQTGAAASRTMTQLAITRFFAGFFGATPLSNSGGSLADIFTPEDRTFWWPVFSVFGFIAPVGGPIIGAYVAIDPHLGWRWVNYISAICGFGTSALVCLFMPETYSAVILDLKATSIRRTTGDCRFVSRHELAMKGKSPFRPEIYLRPLRAFFLEPIVTCYTIYLTIGYIVLFTDFESYPIIFGVFNFSRAKSTLPLIAVLVGIVSNLVIVVPLSIRMFRRRQRQVGPHGHVEPEIRLRPLCYCCWLVPISLFWMGWVAYPDISPWAAIVPGVLFGMGLMQIFISSYSYVIDSYGVNAASCMGTLTLVRYNVSGAFIHIATPMYENLGVHWAASLLGFISLGACAFPFLFVRYGPRIRAMSKTTPPEAHVGFHQPEPQQAPADAGAEAKPAHV